MPKPRSDVARFDLARLPELTRSRRWFRKWLNSLVRLVVWLVTDLRLEGLENIPAEGGALIVCNHLGDMDDLLKLATFRRQLECICKIEFFDVPIFGRLLNAYGVIWIRRGQPDRQALRSAIQGLQEGRLVMINPEGRESLTGALEEGTLGAAFIALKAGTPLLPVTITGTQNERLYHNLKRLHRTQVSLTVGKSFSLQPSGDRHTHLAQATSMIMKILASQLPLEYRGVYQSNNPGFENDSG